MKTARLFFWGILLCGGVLEGCYLAGLFASGPATSSNDSARAVHLDYKPRKNGDTSGFIYTMPALIAWQDPTSLEEIKQSYEGLGNRALYLLNANLANGALSLDDRVKLLLIKATLYLYDGDTSSANSVLDEARTSAVTSNPVAENWLFSVIFLQGITGMRQGENENCLECRGEGACIIPMKATALHKNPAGSRQAIQHFMEYLQQFPHDAGVRWLLNIAYMTLGEHPANVPPEYLMKLDGLDSEHSIGHFKDIGHLLGVNRFNQAGGAIMDDFDNDGLLDLVTSNWDPAQSLAYYRNKGDGTFEDRSEKAGLRDQLGGFNIVQTDYNNDGFLDIFVSRGAWQRLPMRPSLLRNNGNGTFTDVTREAGLMDPINSITATWADYDNDGFLDLFICNETGPNRLYHNRGNGTFEEVAVRAGVAGKEKCAKGAAWIDFDNDGYPDLFVNYLESTPQLFHNNRDGTFSDVTSAMGIDGPRSGFSCWAFDYDNDGWLDIFATSYERTLDEIVHGMVGEPVDPHMDVTRLFRNMKGQGFQDVSKETGVNKIFATMGSNFADFDNDGYLDFYLATGEPSLATLVPNRMFKNVAGQHFREITGSSGTGHLQKGHGVACGDWDRDGNVDLFVETGGITPGDRYHNVLFQNPGQGNHWLTLKLVGKKTNRAAIGARIKVVASGDNPLTVHRHVSSGSSFGANPLQQQIGLGKAKSAARVEIFWPTSGTTQVFRDVAADQAIEITEFVGEYRKLNWTPVPVPKE
jgi:hypothetical protein